MKTRNGAYLRIYVSAYLSRYIGPSGEVGEPARSVDFLCPEMLADAPKHLRLTAGELDKRTNDFHLGTAEVVRDISETSILRIAEIS